MNDTPLHEELEYYESQRASLVAHHEGMFALVHGASLLGTFTTEVEAYEAGLRQIGNLPFLVREIRREDVKLQAPVLFVGVGVGSTL